MIERVPDSVSRSTPPGVECQGHRPPTRASQRRLWWVLGITVLFMGAEVVGGVIANSLALLADAGHMLTDAAAVGLALFVAAIAQRPATAEKTYGYVRFEILAALVNGSALFVIAGLILWEAFKRFEAPPEIEPRILLGVATAGLLANFVSMRILHHGHHHSLNVRGAYLHVLSDMLGSVGAIVAGVVIMATGWRVVDPVISVLVAGLILASAWRLVRESTDVLLEAVPAHIELKEVERELATVPNVTNVHDLHVWTVTSGVVAMSGHVVVPESRFNQGVLETSQERMAKLGIQHATIQIEQEGTC